MPEDEPLKSAYEIAMDRLRAEDREAGVEASEPLTDEQKQEIARLRQEARAKLAELEILHRDAVSAVLEDPEKLQKVEEQHRIDRARVDSRLESAVARVRQGES